MTETRSWARKCAVTRKNEGKWLVGGEYEQQYSGTLKTAKSGWLLTKMYAVGRKYAITIENKCWQPKIAENGCYLARILC